MKDLGLDVYPNQIEVITAEQMLDAYSSVGMPLFYKHWSFGKHFAYHEASYRKGLMGLAYEIVINSSPCISYLMEENTATMQTLVIAHAAFGHNHFFKNNYLFKQWTDAEGILDYLDFAKNYVMQCEERYGRTEVERTLDAAHALMSHGIDRYPGKKKLDLREEEKRAGRRRQHEEEVFNDLWRTVPKGASKTRTAISLERRRKLLGLPQENLLYFLEKSAPRLAPWQRELLRIVRHIAQYFYPQSQTKVMNEGTATYVHYRIMTKLHQQGRITDGNFLEFLGSHTNVVFQPEFDDQRFSGFNPYALGFAMMQDIERIVANPSDEDREWFPDIAGKNDVMGVLRDVWANYRDESFIAQFLSPKLMRQLRMFHLHDDPEERAGIRVDAIHDERGFRRVRRELARQHDVGYIDANIEVVDVDLSGDRRLILHHRVIKGSQLNETDAKRVLQHLADLWTYDVALIEVDANDKVLREYVVSPRPIAAAVALRRPASGLALLGRLLLRLGRVQLHGRADQRLQRLFVDLRALGNIDRAPHIAVEAGIEQAGRVVQRRALGKRHLHDGLVGLAGADDAVVLPHGNAAPFPFLDDLRIGLLDQRADPLQRLAAPVAELLDPAVDHAWRAKVRPCPSRLLFFAVTAFFMIAPRCGGQDRAARTDRARSRAAESAARRPAVRSTSPEPAWSARRCWRSRRA